MIFSIIILRYEDFWLLQGWLYRLEMDGSSQAKLLLDRFVARAAELKIPVSRIKVYFGIIFHLLFWSGIYLPVYEIILKKWLIQLTDSHRKGELVFLIHSETQSYFRSLRKTSTETCVKKKKLHFEISILRYIVGNLCFVFLKCILDLICVLLLLLFSTWLLLECWITVSMMPWLEYHPLSKIWHYVILGVRILDAHDNDFKLGFKLQE